MSFQAEKRLVQDYHAALADDPVAAADGFLGHGSQWLGYHPFGEMTGAEAATRFWRPLQASLTAMQRREDVFFAGRNEIDGFASAWVVSMGHLMGLFDQPWLGIPPTGKIAMLRYCAFYEVAGGKITRQTMYFDLPHLALQAGVEMFPGATAQHLVQPGPLGGRGLLLEDAPEAEGAATLAAINAMIGDLGQWDHPLPLEDELRLSWHEDMIWWGPTGIGATYTVPRYAQQHSGPFRAAFSERSRTGHIARLAEGHFGGFFGWPNFTATLSGPFMGRAATGRRAEFRVIDIYRREGDKLAENWIFIDLLHFWKQQGWDVLAELAGR